MKFARQFTGVQVPEWEPYYLNYAKLKADVKALSSDGLSTESPQQLQAAFLALVQQETDTVERFYHLLLKEESAVWDLHSKIVSRLLGGERDVQASLPDITAFYTWCARLNSVRMYAVSNSLGVLKILKKMRRHIGGDPLDMSLYTHTLSFYHSQELSKLSTSAEALAIQAMALTHPASIIVPPVCVLCSHTAGHRLAISCLHFLCWPCLAARHSTRVTCPVCQTEQALDLAVIKLDSVVARVKGRPSDEDGAGAIPRPPPIKPSSRPRTPGIPWAGGGENDGSGVPVARVRSGNLKNSGGQFGSGLFMKETRGSSLALQMPPFKYTDDSVVSGDQEELPFDTNIKRPHKHPNSLLAQTKDRFSHLRRACGSVIPRRILLLCGCVLLLVAYRLLSGSTTAKHTGAPILPPLPTYPGTVFVGHQNADVDSACGAFAAADLFGGIPAMAPGPYTIDIDYVFSHLKLPTLPLSDSERFKGHSWCLVDHNQADKVPSGVDRSNIVCVLDHHQLLGNPVVMAHPRFVLLQPWGSTCSMLAFLYAQHQRHIPPPVAGCLLAGVLSDTLNLRGPTTTEADRLAVDLLQPLAGLGDLGSFVKGMFAAKSATDNLSEHEIIRMDVKRFVHPPDLKFAFAVAETVSPASLLARSEQLASALHVFKQQEGLDLVFFAVVDMVALQSYVIILNGSENVLLLQALGEHLGAPLQADTNAGHEVRPSKLVSRKKHFVPLLTAYMAGKARAQLLHAT